MPQQFYHLLKRQHLEMTPRLFSLILSHFQRYFQATAYLKMRAKALSVSPFTAYTLYRVPKSYSFLKSSYSVYFYNNIHILATQCVLLWELVLKSSLTMQFRLAFFFFFLHRPQEGKLFNMTKAYFSTTWTETMSEVINALILFIGTLSSFGLMYRCAKQAVI